MARAPFLLSILLSAVTTSAIGQVDPAATRPIEPDYGLEPFDVRSDHPAVKSRIAALAESGVMKKRRAAAADLAHRTPGLAIEIDPALATPHFIRSTRSFLTQSVAGPVDAPSLVKRYVADHPELFGIEAAQLDRARIMRDAVSHNGVRTIWWQQEINGAAVVGADLRVNVLPDGRIASIGSRMLPEAPLQAARAKAAPIERAQAVQRAAANIGVDLAAPLLVKSRTAQRTIFTKTPQVRRDVTADLVYFPVSFEDVRPAHRVMIGAADDADFYEVIVDAGTGEILQRLNHTWYGGGPAAYHVWTSDSPAPMTPGPDSPDGFQPPVVPRDMVMLDAFDPVASPSGWISAGMNETVGNNVDAHTDLDDNEAPDLPRPQGNPFRVFDFPIDVNNAPSTYRDASVVQGFYITNWYHDRLYQLGFTEPFGNFQDDNFGRGGVGGDRVSLDVHDGGGTNNANWNGTGDDGDFTWVQMYIFNGPSPDRDGNLDTHILIHELTHGTSIRLHGGLSETQARGMGEGWGDFFALSLLAEESDPIDGVYAMGGYSTKDGLGNDFKDNYYFGIRRYPYTTDLSKNPLTYNDINSSQFDVDPSIPRNPVFGSSIPSAVHNVGEVWCSNLWEARAKMIEKHGFAGNEIMMQLVIDGMKLTTTSTPTQVQARDAILLADLINNNGENVCDLWEGFAKRGLGEDAFSETPSTTSIGESFNVPSGVQFAIDGAAPNRVEAGVEHSFNVEIRSNCAAPLIEGTTRLVMTINDGPALEIPLTAGAEEHEFVATLPAFACDDVVNYFLAADTADGVFTFPDDGASNPISVMVVTDVLNVVTENFEQDLGWFVFGDAQEGQWERGVPAGNGGQRSDPPTDGDGSGQCFVTDNGFNGDLDNGSTTLMSPAFDATGDGDPLLSYHLWYVNNGNSFVDDVMTIEISNNDGGSWTLLEQLSQSTNGWEIHQFRIADFVEPTSVVRVRFTAADEGSGSIVEAGVDGLVIERVICDASTLPADLNGDGFVNGADLAILLTNWGPGGAADLNDDNIVDGADLAILLTNWT